MKIRLLVVAVLALSVAAFAQRGSHGGGMGGSMGGGNMGDMGASHGDMGSTHGQAGDHGQGQSQQGQQGGMSQTQQPLKQAQMNGGAWTMLENKTGLSSTQLQQLYQSSGAKNYGQFVSAIVVSKNLGLDFNQVLAGLKTQSLGNVLQSMGVSKSKSKDAIKKANSEIKAANSSNG